MSKHRAIAASILAILTAIAVVWWAVRIPEPSYPEAARVTYRYEVSNASSRATRDAKLWIYAPLQSSPTQRLVSIEASEPFGATIDRFGNQILEIELPLLPPYGQREIVVTAQLETSATPNAWSDKAVEEWITPSALIQSEAPEVVALAAEIAAEGGNNQISAIAEWVAEHIKPSNYDALAQGALKALADRRGDCTEFAYLVTALARASGLPARAVDGWTLGEGTLLEAAAFHTWSEVWDGQTWRTVDAHAEAQKQPRSQYIGFRRVPSDSEAIAASFARFRFEGDIKVRMK